MFQFTVSIFCPNIQLLKKPDRSDDAESEKPKEKAKKPEKPLKEDRSTGGSDVKRRQNTENREDRERKSVSIVIFYTCRAHFEQRNRADVVIYSQVG